MIKVLAFLVAIVVTQPAHAQQPPDYGTLVRNMDAIVQSDSRGWYFNRYDVGSMRNVLIIEQNGDLSAGVIHGEYTYNGGSPGWVRVRVADDRVSCVEYHDFAGRCRAGGDYSYGTQVVAGLAAAAVVAGATGSGASPTSGDYERARRRACLDSAGGGLEGQQNATSC